MKLNPKVNESNLFFFHGSNLQFFQLNKSSLKHYHPQEVRHGCSSNNTNSNNNYVIHHRQQVVCPLDLLHLEDVRLVERLILQEVVLALPVKHTPLRIRTTGKMDPLRGGPMNR